MSNKWIVFEGEIENYYIIPIKSVLPKRIIYQIDTVGS